MKALRPWRSSTSHAHHAGFGVRVGQQKKLDNDVVRTKCFMCNREGFRSEKSKEIKVQGKGTEIVRPMKPNGVL